MSTPITRTGHAAPVTQTGALRPLVRRPAPTAPAAAPKDSFTASAQAGRNLKTFVPLGIANRLALVDAPGTTPKTLSQAFDGLKTVGGGTAASRILSKNTDSWNARWDMLTSAKKSIDTGYFIVAKDVYGFAFLGALLKKQMDGVQVRLEADRAGSVEMLTPGLGEDYVQEIVNHGGKAYVYNPFSLRPGEALKPGTAAIASNHDKILVVDGNRSMTGGRNIAAEYLTELADRKESWRDMDIEFTGAGPAKGLTKAFEAEIAADGVARPVKPDSFGNWSKKDIQLLGAFEMMNLWLNDPALSETQKQALRAHPAERQKLTDDLVRRALAKVQGDLPASQRRDASKADVTKLKELAAQLTEQLEARGSRKTYLAGKVAEHAAEVKIVDQTSAAAGTITNGIAPALRQMIASAQHHIVFENPYVVMTEELLSEMEAAGKRGVQIDIVTNSPMSSDSPVTQAFFLNDWPAILARVPNARIFAASGEHKFHIKSAVIDGEQAFVSTYNLDLLSGKVNSEVGAVVKSKDVAGDLAAAFQKDLADPYNGFVEYTIKRNADGSPVLKDGKPVPEFGPTNHLPQKVIDHYAPQQKVWDFLRQHVPQMAPLRHPALNG